MNRSPWRKHTPMPQMITDLSLLALASKFPLRLHSNIQTWSVWTCNIVVVTRGKPVLSHRWSENNEKPAGLLGVLWYTHCCRWNSFAWCSNVENRLGGTIIDGGIYPRVLLVRIAAKLGDERCRFSSSIRLEFPAAPSHPARRRKSSGSEHIIRLGRGERNEIE
jgi:hypothetical protein